MINDVYYNPTRIIFGKDTENCVGAEVARYAKKALVHYGSNSAKKSCLIDRVTASLRAAGVTPVELGGVKGNPALSTVRRGIGLCKEERVEFVLAVGGGSVIDSSKSIAIGVANPDDDIWDDYFIAGKQIARCLPVATVLTIPGAGSESSPNAVVTNEDTRQKLGIGGDLIRPLFSILNPQLTCTVPPYHTAAGVVDGMAHIMERYFTTTPHVDTVDRMSESVLRSLIKNGERVIQCPTDYDARAEVMWACKIAHDGTLGVGREEDWASHSIEHELSAFYDVSHGAGLAVIFPAWMKYVCKNDINRFCQFAMRVFDVEYCFEDPMWTVQEGIRRLTDFFRRINMPVSLRSLGVNEKTDFDKMAEACVSHGGGSIGKFTVLKREDVRNIYDIAY